MKSFVRGLLGDACVGHLSESTGNIALPKPTIKKTPFCTPHLSAGDPLAAGFASGKA